MKEDLLIGRFTLELVFLRTYLVLKKDFDRVEQKNFREKL